MTLLFCVRPSINITTQVEVEQEKITPNKEYIIDLQSAMGGEIIKSGSVSFSTDDIRKIEAKQCDDILEGKLQKIFQSDTGKYVFAINGMPMNIQLIEGRLLIKGIKVTPLFQAKKVKTEINLFLEEADYKNDICIRISREDKPKPGFYYAISELGLNDRDLMGLTIYSVKDEQPNKGLFRFNLNEQGLEALKRTIDFARFLAEKMGYDAGESLESLSSVYQMCFNSVIHEVKCTITKDPQENYYSANLYYPNGLIWPSFSKIPIVTIRFRGKIDEKCLADYILKDFLVGDDFGYGFIPEYPKGSLTLHSVRLLHKTYEFNHAFDLTDKNVREFIVVSLSSCVNRILGRDEPNEHKPMDVLRNIDFKEMKYLDDRFCHLLD